MSYFHDRIVQSEVACAFGDGGALSECTLEHLCETAMFGAHHTVGVEQVGRLPNPSLGLFFVAISTYYFLALLVTR